MTKTYTARPKCEACANRVGNWRVAGVLLCTTCKVTADRAARQFTTELFIPQDWSRERILALAGAR